MSPLSASETVRLTPAESTLLRQEQKIQRSLSGTFTTCLTPLRSDLGSVSPLIALFIATQLEEFLCCSQDSGNIRWLGLATQVQCRQWTPLGDLEVLPIIPTGSTQASTKGFYCRPVLLLLRPKTPSCASDSLIGITSSQSPVDSSNTISWPVGMISDATQMKRAPPELPPGKWRERIGTILIQHCFLKST